MRIVIDTDEIKTKVKRLIRLAREAFSKAREEWSEEQDKDVLRVYRAQQEALLDRAAMNVFSLNTGVVLSTGGEARVRVSSHVDRDWTDCLTLSWHPENGPKGVWQFAHFSPARARLIALQLIERAEAIERFEPSSMTIDDAPGTVAAREAKAKLREGAA